MTKEQRTIKELTQQIADLNESDLTCVNVTQNALIGFIERVAVVGGTNIKVSQGVRGWYVTYRSPFTRDIKEDDSKEISRKDICAFKHPLSDPTKAPCSPQMIAEADCEGNRAKCGDACCHKDEDPHITIEGAAHV